MDNPFETLEARLNKIESMLQLLLEAANNKPMEDAIGDIELAVEITKLKRSTIYSHVHLKKIPFHKQQGKLYFSKSELIEWMKNDSSNSSPVAKKLFPRHKRFKAA